MCWWSNKISTWIKSNDELPAGIGDDSSYSPLVIDDDLNMGDMILWWLVLEGDIESSDDKSDSNEK